MPGIKPQIDRVSVGAESKTLAELLAALDPAKELNASTRRVTLVPAEAGAFMDDGAATVDSHPMTAEASHEFIGGAGELGELAFITAGGAILMTVVQEG